MVKVTNPLGGREAHGSFGKFVTFQGTTAKGYAAPVINKVQAQIDASDKFQSVTKIIGQMKAWGRGGLSAMLGARWYQFVYREVVNYWGDSEIIWLTFEEQDKDDWRSNAPYANTLLDCGLTFFACARAIDLLQVQYAYDFWGMAPPDPYSSLAARDLWDRGLDNVFLAGKYDDTNACINFASGAPSWVRTYSTDALGGSYMLSDLTGLRISSFTFFGNQFGILYHQAILQGSMLVEVDAVNDYIVSQNNPSGLWQVEWLSPVFNRGLHRVSVSRYGADGRINIDGVVIYG